MWAFACSSTYSWEIHTHLSNIWQHHCNQQVKNASMRKVALTRSNIRFCFWGRIMKGTSWTFIQLRFYNHYFDLVLFKPTSSAPLDRSLIFSQTEYLKSIYGSKLISTGQRTKELFWKKVDLIIHLTFKRIFPKWLQIANSCWVYHNGTRTSSLVF